MQPIFSSYVDLFLIIRFTFFSGYAYDTDCIYINGTGANEYEFYIQLNRCGTLGGSDHNKKRDAKYKNTEPTVSFFFEKKNQHDTDTKYEVSLGKKFLE